MVGSTLSLGPKTNQEASRLDLTTFSNGALLGEDRPELGTPETS